MDIAHRRRFFHALTLGIIIVPTLVVISCKPAYRPGREPVRVESQDQGIPTWVLQPPMDPEYTYGVGTDLRMDRTRAIAEGRRDIARQLRIVISGDEPEINDFDTEDDIANRPRVSIDHLELPGITVTKQAETEHCLYLQVALNRTAWATGLRSRLTELDRDISAVLTKHQQQPEIDPATHPVGAAAQLHQELLPLVSLREEKLAHLLIAKSESVYPAAPITSADMRERLRRVLDQVSVDVVAAPDLEPILPQLTATCASIGLRIAPGAAKPTLRLKLTLNSNKSVVDGMERLDGKFLCLIEMGDGTNLGSISILLRSNSLTDTVAHDRLMRKILVRWAEFMEKDFVTHLKRL